MPNESTASPEGGGTLKPTDTRKAALREVMDGGVEYVTGSGSFYVGGEELTGARRRTFAEFRRAELVTGGGQADRRRLTLTDLGRRTAREWGLISQ